MADKLVANFYAMLHVFGTDAKKNDEGATAVEYGLIIALIAAIIVGVVALLGTDIQAAFQTVVDAI